MNGGNERQTAGERGKGGGGGGRGGMKNLDCRTNAESFARSLPLEKRIIKSF